MSPNAKENRAVGNNFELVIDNFDEDKSRQISRKHLKTRERGTSLVCPSSEARRGESTGRLVV